MYGTPQHGLKISSNTSQISSSQCCLVREGYRKIEPIQCFIKQLVRNKATDVAITVGGKGLSKKALQKNSY